MTQNMKAALCGLTHANSVSEVLRCPGFEPGSPAWKAGVLATGPTPQIVRFAGYQKLHLEFRPPRNLLREVSSRGNGAKEAPTSVSLTCSVIFLNNSFGNVFSKGKRFSRLTDKLLL